MFFGLPALPHAQYVLKWSYSGPRGVVRQGRGWGYCIMQYRDVGSTSVHFESVTALGMTLGRLDF